jgi:YD repeat-containing protein
VVQRRKAKTAQMSCSAVFGAAVPKPACEKPAPATGPLLTEVPQPENHLPGPEATPPTQPARAGSQRQIQGADKPCGLRVVHMYVESTSLESTSVAHISVADTSSVDRWAALLLACLTVFFLFTVPAKAQPSPTLPAVVDRYGYDPLGRLTHHVDPAGLITVYGYDAAGNLAYVTVGGLASGHVPVLSSVVPSLIRRGETRRLVIAGQHLQSGSLRATGSGLALLNVQQAASQIQLDLSADGEAPLGPQSLGFSNAQASATIGITVAPVLPTLSVEPSPLALPPDNAARQILLRLSSTDLIAHEVRLSMSDTAKAVVSPARVTIGAGLTSALVSITPKAAGFASLQLLSDTLAAGSVPVFITADFRGVNTSQAWPVGVVVGSAAPPASSTPATWVTASPVGVSLGPVLTGLQPKGLSVGTTQTLVVTGQRIPAGASLSVVPGAGLSLGATSADADGQRLSAVLAVAQSAAAGTRSVVVRDASGKALPFVPPGTSQLVITSGQPEIHAIEPLYAKPGSGLRLRVRGRHLQGARLALLPATDIAVDPQPSINAEGTELLVTVQVFPLAALGPRLVLVTTASGNSGMDSQAANQFNVVADILGQVGPVVSATVGVVVASPPAPPTSATTGPVAAANVGVLVGAAADSVNPKVVVVGTSADLQVTGVGLQAVRSVSLVTPDGITASPFQVNTEGSLLTLPITVEADAPKTSRRLLLNTATGRLPFLREGQSGFLVAAPAPQILATAPTVIQAGKTVTLSLRGQHFRDVLAVRFEPEQGLAVSPGATPTASADGQSLSVSVTAAAAAETGPRTVIVVTAGGESTSAAGPANTVQVARQLGPTLADISAPTVGLVVGNANPPATPSALLLPAPSVGVVVQPAAAPVQNHVLTAAAPVGVVLGAWVRGLQPTSPDGFVAGSAATLQVEGAGLGAVTNLRVLGPAGAPAAGAAGITFGTWSVNAAGTLLTAPVNLTAAVPSGTYALALTQTLGSTASRLITVPPTALQFNVGKLPQSLESVAPIVLEQGKSYSFSVRGTGLRDVYQLSTEPAGGLVFGTVQWTSDAFGELLTSTVRIDADAAIGSRVVRLRVPGGITGTSALPANTITVVPPQ